MLPDAQHAPAAGAKFARHAAIARAVARDLLAPERRVLPRLRAVDRAAVPEAAVDEDGLLALNRSGEQQLCGEQPCANIGRIESLVCGVD